MRGMTLVELVVVVGLLGVLSALALVGAQPLAHRYHQRDAVELASQLVSEAQVRARATGRCHRVVAQALGVLATPGTAGDALVLEARPTADCESSPASVTWTQVDRAAMPSGTSALNVNDASGTLTEFRPNGRVRIEGGVGVGALLVRTVGLSDQLVRTVNQGATCLFDAASPGACP